MLKRIKSQCWWPGGQRIHWNSMVKPEVNLHPEVRLAIQEENVDVSPFHPTRGVMERNELPWWGPWCMIQWLQEINQFYPPLKRFSSTGKIHLCTYSVVDKTAFNISQNKTATRNVPALFGRYFCRDVIYGGQLGPRISWKSLRIVHEVL